MKRTTMFRDGARRPPQKGPALINFMLGDDIYALDIRSVIKVELRILVTPLPSAPSFIVGLTFTDDELVTVVDLKRFMEVRGAAREPKALIIVQVEGSTFALLSDTVPGFITVDATVQQVSEEEVSILSGVASHDGTPVNIIDTEQLYWILTGQVARLQRRLLKALKETNPALAIPNIDQATCEACKGRGRRLENESDLFATVLAAISELALSDQVPPAALNASELRDSVAQALAEADPSAALTTALLGQLGPDGLRILLRIIEERHWRPCPLCDQSA